MEGIMYDQKQDLENSMSYALLDTFLTKMFANYNVINDEND
jgi:hypothetical protein